MIHFTLVERLTLIVQKAPAADLETTTHMFRYVLILRAFQDSFILPHLAMYIVFCHTP